MRAPRLREAGLSVAGPGHIGSFLSPEFADAGDRLLADLPWLASSAKCSN
jgi:hypothetical protein